LYTVSDSSTCFARARRILSLDSLPMIVRRGGLGGINHLHDMKHQGQDKRESKVKVHKHHMVLGSHDVSFLPLIYGLTCALLMSAVEYLQTHLGLGCT